MTLSVPAKMTTGVIEAGMTMRAAVHAAARAIAGGGHAAQPM